MHFLPGKRAVLVVLAVVALAFWVPGQAAAYTTFSFYNITNNGNPDLSGQLFVDVYGTGEKAPKPAGETITIGANEVGFYFRNVGATASAVKEIYFDDGSLVSGPTIYDYPLSGNTGVDFVLEANPANLPGGNDISPKFVASVWFNSQAAPPPGLDKNGIDINESLLLIFVTNGDILASLDDLSLRIGLHVGSIGTDEGSDSYVNRLSNGDIPVPVPASALLLGSGLLGLIGLRRKFKG